jgi:16S rRNA (cytosine1402-N4)-methyltransferase
VNGPPAPVHVPVMRAEILELLTPPLLRTGAPAAVLVDLTLGLAGHLRSLLEATGPSPEGPNGPAPAIVESGALRTWRSGTPVAAVGIDRDPEALERAAVVLAGWAPAVRLVHATADQLPDVLSGLGLHGADAVLADLGVSSLQLDSDRRGFSYSRDVGLDMRMDPTAALDAATVVNTYSVEELTRVLRAYGEERYARRIADRIARARSVRPLTGTRELADLVVLAYPSGPTTGGHPAKRTFQALRIEVNAELSGLEQMMPAAIDALRPAGRLAVLAYHSGEDRIVKRALAAAARPDVPDGLPQILPGHGPRIRLLTRGAGRPGAAEVAANPRAASARLRAAERLVA